jgi:hypothetical protein
VHPPHPITRYELLPKTVLPKTAFPVGVEAIRLTKKVCVARQKVVVVFAKIVAQTRAEHKLLQIADGIEISVLGFGMDIPLLIYRNVSEIHHPIAYIALLRVPCRWGEQYEQSANGGNQSSHSGSGL